MTLAARLAPHLPDRVIAATAHRVYPRFEPELRRLADFCPRGGTAVDIGGWYGPWTRRLARRADRVVTVEPVPGLARALRATTPGNVRVVGAAAGEHDGTATLWLPPGGTGERGVSSLVRRDQVHATGLEVPCVSVDGLGLTDVRLVKIDVDGHEAAVLRGAEATLRRWRPALFVELETRIQPLAPVLELLTAHGYEGWVLPAAHWIPLAAFNLAEHQEHTAHVAEHGLLRRTLLPHRRYVNSVLFLPTGRTPAIEVPRAARRAPPPPRGPAGPLPRGSAGPPSRP
ncbi:FkbM family methyltransferase [Streptomyces sp. JJ66]|uniref:FkbM family methyltransferase n=1 Tax=Streptomyces sp. JJ66 TaxID=2803843 RepID=UPI001C5A3ED5|nr:FkbM family methyltransferase [Streptomyces sp. JJ66]MBW1600972.1 FkbM family methyltransferase [Streptomyces sp. JJ66]